MFLAILFYGLFLGTGGFLNPKTPVPTEVPPSPTLSISPAPTGTPAATGTPAPSGTPERLARRRRRQVPLPHRRPQPERPRQQPRAPLDAPVERLRLDRRSAGAEGNQGPSRCCARCGPCRATSSCRQTFGTMAYNDGALPIGHGQTISQPYIVARMTQTLAAPRMARRARRGATQGPRRGHGLRLPGALCSRRWARRSFSVELEPTLAERARVLLKVLGYEVDVRVGDGSAGAPDEAPFAGIIVAAAAPQVPVPLVEQLEPDGRLVIPIGTRWEQVITLVRPTGDGFAQEPVEPAVFVPLAPGRARSWSTSERSSGRVSRAVGADILGQGWSPRAWSLCRRRTFESRRVPVELPVMGCGAHKFRRSRGRADMLGRR